MTIKSVFAAVITEDRKEIMLIMRRDVPVWVLPGGGVEENETLEDAAIREVKEETGLSVSVSKCVASYTSKGPFIKPVNLYECKVISGTAKPSDEVRRVQFFPIDKLPKKLPPPFDEFIADTIKNTTFIQREITTVTIPRVIKNFILHPILAFRFILSRIGLHINSK